ncbi:K+-sensing histidine kinase KdpD [Rhizobium brockwellii]
MSLERDFGHRQAGAVADPFVVHDAGLSEVPIAVQYLVSFIMVVMATAIAAGFDRYEAIPNLSLIYVLPVVIGSVAFGIGPALFCALLGSLAYNFFFTEPRFSLAVADTANIWAIALLFIVGCITSAIASMRRRDAAALDRYRRSEEKLKIYARQMIAAASAQEAKGLTRSALASLFQAPVVVIRVGKDDDLKIEGENNLSSMEAEAARTALTSQSIVNAGVYPFDESRFDFWPAQSSNNRAVVIGVAFDPERRPANADATVGMMVLVLAATIDRCDA